MLNNNFLSLLITFAVTLIWLRVNDFLAHKGWISSHLSRKIIHMGTGPLFVLCWLLFTNHPTARYLAALVPLVITIQFAMIGLGIIQDEAAVQAMSRTGDRREVLKGPLFYGIIFVVLTIVYWKNSPIGITALMLMCGGDGMADIIGRRFGKTPLPWAKHKTWVGSLGMLLGGWVFTVFILFIYTYSGIFNGTLVSYLPAITIISIVATLVESLPIDDFDNITVVASAIILGTFLLH